MKVAEKAILQLMVVYLTFVAISDRGPSCGCEWKMWPVFSLVQDVVDNEGLGCIATLLHLPLLGSIRWRLIRG